MTGAGDDGGKNAGDDIVNLNRFRKRKRRAEEERRAAQNRQAHGRTKQEKMKDADDRRRRDGHLDGCALPPEGDDA